MSHLLLHEASVYNGHLRKPVTLTSITDRLTVKLLLPDFPTQVCCGWELNTQLPHARLTPPQRFFARVAFEQGDTLIELDTKYFGQGKNII